MQGKTNTIEVKGTVYSYGKKGPVAASEGGADKLKSGKHE